MGCRHGPWVMQCSCNNTLSIPHRPHALAHYGYLDRCPETLQDHYNYAWLWRDISDNTSDNHVLGSRYNSSSAVLLCVLFYSLASAHKELNPGIVPRLALQIRVTSPGSQYQFQPTGFWKLLDRWALAHRRLWVRC